MRQWLQSAWEGLDREAWLRFFGAMAGLTLAFGAALFSTVTRDAGNILATAVLAGIALLMAGWVGLTTVPFLAKRVAVSKVRDALDYEVTREGIVYMILVLVIGIAALNTGNNLLFIIVSAMMAAILVSGVASAATLRHIELELGLPRHVFAGTTIMARVGLTNTTRFWPAFSVSVVPPKTREEKSKWVLHQSEFRWPRKAAPERQWFKVPDLYLSRMVIPAVKAEILKEPIYFPYIPPDTQANAELELTFSKRGRFVQDGFGLSTKFPFSFLAKTRRVALAKEAIVYPSVEETDELFDILPIITGEFAAFLAGRGCDLYRIREYRSEDSARYVDWKATAKTGDLKVREFTREDERKLRIIFDNPLPGVVTPEVYERSVTLASSLAWHFAGQGTELSFITDEPLESNDVYGFLRYLALVEPRPQQTPVLKGVEATDDFNVVFTTIPRGSVPTPLWNRSYIVFLE